MTDLQTSSKARMPLPLVFVAVGAYIVATFIIGGIITLPLFGLFGLLPKSDAFEYVLLQESINAVSVLAGAWVAAWFFLRFVNNLPYSSLGMSIRGRLPDCLAGIAFAIVLYAIAFGISLAANAFEIAGLHVDPIVLLSTFLFFLVAAAMEEIMIRGYVQGVLMTRINKYVALLVASAIFSIMHGLNPGIGVLPFINIFVAGLLLGASYMYTRNLWFPIFLHASWNWLQGPVLGYKVSGTSVFPTMLQLNWTEDNLINGGQFGFEGSILCTIFGVAATALIIRWYERKRKSKD